MEAQAACAASVLSEMQLMPSATDGIFRSLHGLFHTAWEWFYIHIAHSAFASQSSEGGHPGSCSAFSSRGGMGATASLWCLATARAIFQLKVFCSCSAAPFQGLGWERGLLWEPFSFLSLLAFPSCWLVPFQIQDALGKERTPGTHCHTAPSVTMSLGDLSPHHSSQRFMFLVLLFLLC